MLYKQSIRNSSIDLSTFTDHKKLGCAVDYRQKVMWGGGRGLPLQEYMNQELPDVQAGFRKGRGTRDQTANIHWIIEKARKFQ